MFTGFYLLDNPNRVCAQYGGVRRGGDRLSGVIVMHTTESVPDWVGPDTGAETVAEWLTRRNDHGSYHVLVDGDSTVPLAPWDAETWHDIATNTHSVGISIATQAHRWAEAPTEWKDAALRRAAEAAASAARHIKTVTGITVPARWLTREEAHSRVPGFVRHGTSDPANRSDPWPAGAPEETLFLNYYRAAMAGEDITMSLTADQNNALSYVYNNMGRLMQVAEALDKNMNGVLAPRVNKAVHPDGSKMLIACQGDIDRVLAGQAKILANSGGAGTVALSDDQVDDIAKSVAESIPDSLAQAVVDELVNRLAT